MLPRVDKEEPITFWKSDFRENLSQMYPRTRKSPLNFGDNPD